MAVILAVKEWMAGVAGHGRDLRHQDEAQTEIPKWRLRQDHRRCLHHLSPSHLE